ncbi:hypothetical protein N9164_09625 [Draconibacterium sp.]|nr:hypothetical protein [Draconibacterium sp.]
MKNNTSNFIGTLVLAIVFSQFLPWWSVMLAAYIAAVVFVLKRAAVFFVPFAAIGLFWMVYAFLLSNANDFILAKKIAILLPLQGSSPLLIIVTGLIGGLAAGIAAIFGKQCVKLIQNKS